MEAGGIGVQGHAQLYDHFEISLDYIRPCPRERKRGKGGEGAKENKGSVFAYSKCIEKVSIIHFPIIPWVSESLVLPISIAVCILNFWPELSVASVLFSHFTFQERHASVQLSKEEPCKFTETKQLAYPPLSS